MTAISPLPEVPHWQASRKTAEATNLQAEYMSACFYWNNRQIKQDRSKGKVDGGKEIVEAAVQRQRKMASR
jgi:hypothetical protein